MGKRGWTHVEDLRELKGSRYESWFKGGFLSEDLHRFFLEI